MRTQRSSYQNHRKFMIHIGVRSKSIPTQSQTATKPQKRRANQKQKFLTVSTHHMISILQKSKPTHIGKYQSMRAFKLMLVRWRSQPIKYRVQERRKSSSLKSCQSGSSEILFEVPRPRKCPLKHYF